MDRPPFLQRRVSEVRAAAGWSGTIVLGSGIVVYVGPGASATAHRHDAIQLIWSLDRPVAVDTEQGRLRTRAALVASRVPHALDTAGSPVAIVLVEPAGGLGRQLDDLARRTPDLAGVRPAELAVPTTTDADAVVGWTRQLITAILGAPAARSADVRAELLEASQYIDAHLGQAPRLADVAAEVGLSPRQLRRSFVDEIGMPYRRYVLWRRLRCAVLRVRDGHDLTTAAAAAGFADSPHFSRTFRDTFGLTPSEVLPLLTVAEADFADG